MGRLYWCCRRGMLELDLILIPFLEQRYSELSAEDQALFQEYLDTNDPELHSWLTAKSCSVDPRFVKMTQIIRDHARNHSKSG